MDKFDSCPHCQKAGDSAMGATTPMFSPGGSDMTAPINSGPLDVTMPLDQPPGQAPSPAFDSSVPTAPVPPISGGGVGITPTDIPTEPLNPGDPMVRYDGNIEPVKPTDQMGQSTPSSLSKLVEISQQTAPTASEEKTVGIYSSLAKNKPDSANKFTVEPVVGWLVCIKGGDFGASYNLKSGKNFIGRDSNMDVCIPSDKSISRQCHAIVIYDPKSGKFLVQPGTSRELFYLNEGVVLGVEEISANDVLTVGKTDLMFMPFCSDSFSWEEQIKKINAEEEE
jgi:hypothetical protein